MKEIYVDNAASTKVRPEVLDAMYEADKYYGNPSCIHRMGQCSRELIEAARAKVAVAIGAEPNEIIFTSGGTESNNTALCGFAHANRSMGGHIITTEIEHSSVLKPAKHLYRKGYDITYLRVDGEGRINVHQLQKAIRRDTILISVIFANNEIGTIQPIEEIGRISKLYNICFHTDAVQALGHCPINVHELNIGMMSLSGHKIYAPKGVGVLYARNGLRLTPLLQGGGQEFQLRSGTENTSSIVGMGRAVELLDQPDTRISAMREKLISGIQERIQGTTLNGSLVDCLPNIVNISFDGIEGETLVTMLSEKGIYASNSAACLYSHLEPSHVLTSIGLSDTQAYGSVRFSFGIYNTEDEVDHILDVLPELIQRIREEDL